MPTEARTMRRHSPTFVPTLLLGGFLPVAACAAQETVAGDGAFEHRRVDIGATSADVIALDVDRDGRPEAVFAADGEVVVVAAVGDGDVAVRERVPAGEGPTDLVALDIDGDGWTDLVVANHDTDYLTLLFGGPDGFASGRQRRVPAGVSPHPHALVLTDLDADGRPDLLVDDRDAERLARYHLGEDGTPAPAGHVPVGGDPYRGMAAADVDGDGHVDVVTPNPRTVAIQWGSASGAFTAGPELRASGVTPFGVAVADVDGDGMADIGAAGGEGEATFALWLGRGDRRLEPAPGSPWEVPDGPGMVDAGDVDGDGVTEFLLSSWTGRSLTLISVRDGRARITPIELGGNPWGAAVADFDGDGRMDIAVANSGSREVSFLMGRTR